MLPCGRFEPPYGDGPAGQAQIDRGATTMVLGVSEREWIKRRGPVLWSLTLRAMIGALSAACAPQERLIGEYLSPDGMRVVAQVEREGGATVSFNRHLRLTDKRWWVPFASSFVLGVKTVCDLRVQWLDNRTLLVHGVSDKTYYSDDAALGVEIRYQLEKVSEWDTSKHSSCPE